MRLTRRRRPCGTHVPPGKLTEALGVAGEYDGSAQETPLELNHTDLDPGVTVSARGGVSAAEDWLLRFTVTDNEYISAP